MAMLRPNPRGDFPVVAAIAFVDPTAILCGHVIVEGDVFIGPYAVIRADEADENGHVEPIRIGSGADQPQSCCPGLGRRSQYTVGAQCAFRYCPQTSSH